MATSASCGTPLWVDGPAIDAQSPLRQFDIGSRVIDSGSASAVQVTEGVFPSVGGMAVTAGSGLGVNVAAGYCCVASDAGSLDGGYIFGLLTSTSLTLNSADPVSARIDLIVAQVTDTGTSASTSQVAVVTGTPALNPAAPTPPTDSLILAQVRVTAGASSVRSSNITDKRTWVVAPGGILPIASAAVAPAAPVSQFMYNIATNSLVQGAGSAGAVQAVSVLPWTPVLSVVTGSLSDTAAKGHLTTITTASVTTDGSTDIGIFYKWPGFTVSSGPLLVTMQVSIGGAVLDQTVIFPASSSAASCGGSARYWTSPGTSNTPSAGNHTVTFAFQSASTSITTTLAASASAQALLRVEPVTA